MTATSPARNVVRLLTPPGAGAIAIVRVTGPQAIDLLSGVFQPGRGTRLTTAGIGALRYGRFVDGDEVIDDVLACIVRREPTPTVEISCHGGVRVVERILQVLENRGAAFQDGSPEWQKSSVPSPAAWRTENAIEREVIDALTRATTERAVRFLARQRLHLAARIEQAIESLTDNESSGRAALEALLADSTAARMLVNGATVAIVGSINAGKSTLFNRLAGRGAAIVAATGGTTRDWIEATIELDGFPITLVDTAGTSDSRDWLDCVAIETGRGRSDAADLLIGLVDGQSDDVMDQLRALRERVASRPIVLGVNKCEPMWDRLTSRSMTGWKACPTPWAGFDERLVELSALDGGGVSDLISAVRHDLGIERLGDESLTLFSDRQVRVVSAALSDDSPACEVAACLRQAILDG